MKFKKYIVCILALIEFWVIARFCHHQTEGFRLTKLHHNISPIPDQKNPLLSIEQKRDIQNLLRQKFRYLGRGLQSFSFLSEDGETVLKLFNNRYQTRLFWLGWVPTFGPLKNWKATQIAYFQEKLIKTFASYQIAFDHLQMQTGLIYFHPSRLDEQLPTITLVDKLNIAHQINPNEMGFVLQKKATLAYPYLEACGVDGKSEKAKQAIYALVNLLRFKMEKGIADRDPLIRTNLGFLDEQAMQIDIGPLSHDPTLTDPTRQKKEMEKITLSLKHWLENHHPEFTQFLNEALESL